MKMVIGMISALMLPLFTGRRPDNLCSCRIDKRLREHLSENEIDKMVMDSFPASDPPSTY